MTRRFRRVPCFAVPMQGVRGEAQSFGQMNPFRVHQVDTVGRSFHALFVEQRLGPGPAISAAESSMVAGWIIGLTLEMNTEAMFGYQTSG